MRGRPTITRHGITTDRSCAQPNGFGPNGRRFCRWCHGEVPEGRFTFCSKGCVHDYRMECEPAYLKSLAFKRDRGVCATCGCDTERLRRACSWSFRGGSWGHPWGPRDALRAWLIAEGWTPGIALWQADHIVPVIEGGANHLDNIRTLCVPCHKAETARLAARLAASRRDDRAELFREAVTA